MRRIHLWLGLGLGAIFVLLGVTGSALVFYVEIDALLNPEVRVDAAGPAPGWDSAVWDRALAIGRARWSDPSGTWSLEATGQGGAIPARYYPPSSLNGHHAGREMLWFSADGSRILRAEPWGGYAMSWLYELHMHLLAGEAGRQVVGWSGFAVLVLLLTGIAAWWPRGGWRKAVAFKRRAAPIRRLHDLHKLSGLWSALLLFVLAGTGALLALPGIRAGLLAAFIAAPAVIPAPLSTASNGRQVPVAKVLAAARAALPDARLAFVDVPGAGADPFRVRVQLPGDPHARFPASFVFVDQYTGRVLAVHDARKGGAGTSVGNWLRPLHDASVGGLPTRILGVVIGLAPLLLFITGVLRWRRRIAARAASASTFNLMGNQP